MVDTRVFFTWDNLHGNRPARSDELDVREHLPAYAIFPNHNTKTGNRIVRNKLKTMTRMKGNKSRRGGGYGVFINRQVVIRHTPKGGVTPPIARFNVMMTPK